MSESFSVGGIDHVELYVSDWDDAAAWYERVLGLSPDETFERWWVDADGPLVLTDGDDGTAKLALFERQTASRGESVSPRRVAFRTDGDGFLSFLGQLADLDLTNCEGGSVTAADVSDHGLSYSVYFTDPDGNPIELTTYDYETVSAELES